MRINPKIQKIIEERVLQDRAKDEREMSGRLSAGKLGWPLQWQMLNYYKIPQKEIDEYTLRKFVRGKDVEDRIVEWVNPTRMQEDVVYRGVFGKLDLMLDYPVEVKSVTNMAFKHIAKEGVKRGHKLQGELYAKALGLKQFAVAYVASDDYRVLCFELDVSDEVDEVIDQYNSQVKTGIVPVFEELEPWQGMDKYSIYPEWRKLDDAGIASKLQEHGIVVPVPLLTV